MFWIQADSSTVVPRSFRPMIRLDLRLGPAGATTGPLITTGVETVDAGLVWVTEIAFRLAPTGNGLVGVTENVPLGHVVVWAEPLTVTVTVFPVTQVPEMTGVGFVLVVGIGLTVTCGTIELSRTKGTVAVAGLPAVSLVVAVGLDDTLVGLVPVQVTDVDVATVGLQVVPGIVVVEPTSTLLHVMTAAVVPLDGFGTAVHVGAAGAVVSTKTLATGDGADTPNELVAVDVKLCKPSVKAVVLHVHVPAAVTVVVQTGVVLVPSSSLIVSPAVPVPVTVGVEFIVKTGVVELAGLESVAVIAGVVGADAGNIQFPVTSLTVIITS